MGPTINIPTLSNPGLLTGQPEAVAKTSLWHFVLSEKRNRWLLGIAFFGTVFQFIIFKLLYPFPDFFSDSYSYLFAAYAHLDISIWPIGYSKFLSLFHFFTDSAILLVAFQYFFLEIAALLFFFTILYYLKPAKNTTNIIFVFLCYNPLFLYVSNYINSDPLFIALSLFWFTQLLWILYRPTRYQIATHSILLFLCFTIRNNAYYYPLITAVAYMLSRENYKWKLIGIVTPFLLIIPFFIHTRNVAYKMTGTYQYSLFTGWQLANNALYIYKDITVYPEDFPSIETRELDTLSKTFYQYLLLDFHEYLNNYVGNFFIRERISPLKKYLNKHYTITDGYTGVVAWGKASAVFDEFGKTIIKNNLSTYMREYILSNTKNYFAPPLEKMEIYNLGLDSVENIASYWFNIKNGRVQSVSKKLQGSLLYVFTPIFFLINIYLIIWSMQYIIRKKYKNSPPLFNKMLLLTGGLFLVNFFFCVTATIIVFRYEIFPLIIGTALSLVLLEFSDKKEFLKNHLAHLQEKKAGVSFKYLPPSNSNNIL